jgi:hypothetical protein
LQRAAKPRGFHDASVFTEDTEWLAIPIKSEESAVSFPIGAGSTGDEERH